MAESIWWMDGRPMLVGDGLSEDEVGEGWIVLVSECALAQIEAAFGPVTRKTAVVRRYERYEKDSENHREDGRVVTAVHIELSGYRPVNCTLKCQWR